MRYLLDSHRYTCDSNEFSCTNSFLRWGFRNLSQCLLILFATLSVSGNFTTCLKCEILPAKVLEQCSLFTYFLHPMVFLLALAKCTTGCYQTGYNKFIDLNSICDLLFQNASHPSPVFDHLMSNNLQFNKFLHQKERGITYHVLMFIKPLRLTRIAKELWR